MRSHEAGAEEPRQDWLQWLQGVCSGEDYPVFAFPPDTSFLCSGRVQGYYADPEADCQTFHVCANLGDGDLTKYSLLCPNGTLFNQQYFICDWWFNVDCSTVW